MAQPGAEFSILTAALRTEAGNVHRPHRPAAPDSILSDPLSNASSILYSLRARCGPL